MSNPATCRVLTFDVPEPRRRRRLHRRKPLPESLNKPRIGQRQRPRVFCRISASVSRSASCSSFVGRPRRRLRAACSSFRCLRVRSTTNGELSGAPVNGSSSTKSSRVSGRISFRRPPVFHRVSMNSRFSDPGPLTAARLPRGRAGSGACRCRRRQPGFAAPRRFHSQSSAWRRIRSRSDQ